MPLACERFRVALTTRDYDRLVKFYCTGLGLEPAQEWTHNGSHGLMLEMGLGTLELFDEGYAAHIDQTDASCQV